MLDSEKVCECCGQTLPPRLDLGIRLSPVRRRILDEVVKAGRYGIRSERLVSMIYESQADGGPISAQKALHVQVFHLNSVLAMFGKRIRSVGPHGGSSGCGSYALIDLAQMRESTTNAT